MEMEKERRVETAAAWTRGNSRWETSEICVRRTCFPFASPVRMVASNMSQPIFVYVAKFATVVVDISSMQILRALRSLSGPSWFCGAVVYPDLTRCLDVHSVQTVGKSMWSSFQS